MKTVICNLQYYHNFILVKKSDFSLDVNSDDINFSFITLVCNISIQMLLSLCLIDILSIIWLDSEIKLILLQVLTIDLLINGIMAMQVAFVCVNCCDSNQVFLDNFLVPKVIKLLNERLLFFRLFRFINILCLVILTIFVNSNYLLDIAIVGLFNQCIFAQGFPISYL